MSYSIGRGGRRRRVLNDEMISASGLGGEACGSADSDVDGVPPRYCEQGRVRAHPRVTDLLPRTVFAVLLGGVCGMALLVSLWGGAMEVSRSWGGVDLPARAISNMLLRVAAWLGSSIVLCAGGVAWMLYAVRRHRLNDYRGRYRIWFLAAIGLVLLSLETSAHVTRDLVELVGIGMGWGATPASVWWLYVPIGLIVGWVAIVAFIDAWESRLARGCLAVAGTFYLACFVLAVSSQAASVVAEATIGANSEFASTLAMIAGWVGHVWLLSGLVAYGRYVVLDCEGHIGQAVGTADSVEEQGARLSAEEDVDEPSVSSEILQFAVSETAESETDADSDRQQDQRQDDCSEVDETMDEAIGEFDDDSFAGMSKRQRKAAQRQKKRKEVSQRRSSDWDDYDAEEFSEAPRRKSKSQRKRTREQRNQRRAA